jgi:hypothetical protein
MMMLVALAISTGVTASAELPDKEKVIPVLEMDNVLLTDALRQVAATAKLNVLLDPRLSQPPYSTMTVSIRWENVTATEALTALLDNHGLVLVDSSRSRLFPLAHHD